MDERLYYALNFPIDQWSDEDYALLEPFATNPDGFVSVLHNLPSEIVGALCSRASRAPGSLLRVLLDEYLYPILNGKDAELAEELRGTVSFLRERGFKKILNNQRAQQFYVKWLAQYGDDSIAQMTGTHVVFWGISQVAMKFAQDQRIGLEPIEKSTRFVPFGTKVGGRYLYYRPQPDLNRLNLSADYEAVLDSLFDTYVALQQPLIQWFKNNFNEKEAVLEKKAFDTLRGLLPMATLSQVAFRGNAQAYEYLINRTAQHSLGELRWIAGALKTELDKEIPSLLVRISDQKSVSYQHYLAGKNAGVRVFLETAEYPKMLLSRSCQPTVRLVEYDPDAENKIVAGIIFPATNALWEEALTVARSMSDEQKRSLFNQYLSGRTERWQKVGRAFENSYLRFEIEMNIGAYRDLHRHRMHTQQRQPFNTLLGYDVPVEIQEAGLTEQFSAPLERASQLYFRLGEEPELAQYVVPLAYRVRFQQYQNFRELFWETEIRTTAQGHPDYRFIEQEKFRLVKEIFPLIACHMLVDEKQYSFARRGVEEAIQKKEARLTERLGKVK